MPRLVARLVRWPRTYWDEDLREEVTAVPRKRRCVFQVFTHPVFPNYVHLQFNCGGYWHCYVRLGWNEPKGMR